ncbi:histone deacetylase family protein [Natrinema altunense]|uniref:Histone deacetylase superfamily protein n=2 Tax=Natrinema altunense TaxID=222984 RepID=L9ZD05_NATA2|nr:histone deacetylase [Natrinema altunense]ELY84284.1 histone deacetylase superfamily protein [Natrinema altunense JCM 12890]RZH69243.1 histone deacetylase [Natrinema altunense]
MQFGYSELCLAHDPGSRHPESPDRLRAIRERLKKKHGVEYVEADPCDLDRMAAVHERDYLESVREFCADGGGSWDPDTTAVEETWEAIRRSAGLACWAAEAALEGATGRDTPFSIGRPPGHHAVSDNAMGFCFVDNVAVAAQHALDHDAYDVDRVAIIDWDVHHGNGTQDIFYDRGDVFFVSLHEQGLYPGTGDIDETGTGEGEGTTMNVPMPAGTDDRDYLAALEGPITAALTDFDPDLLLISAGFDAHRHDPISRIRLSTEAYALLSDRVRSLAADTDAALAFVLEGGYGLDVLADSVALVHETFDGREPIEPEDEPGDKAESALEDVIDAHDLEITPDEF